MAGDGHPAEPDAGLSIEEGGDPVADGIDAGRVARSSGADNGMALDAAMAHELLEGLQRNRGLTHVALNANQMLIADVCAVLRAANSTLRRLEMRGASCKTLYSSTPYCREALVVHGVLFHDGLVVATQLAEALGANTALTSLDVRENKLKQQGRELLEQSVPRAVCVATDPPPAGEDAATLHAASGMAQLRVYA